MAPTAGPTQSSILLPQVDNYSQAPDLPLNSIPTRAVHVRFVVEHRSALNEHKIRVRGVITAAFLGDAACPPDRGMCAQPSVILGDSEPCKNRLSCSIRVLMPEGTKPQDFPIGKLLELRATVSGHKTGVVMTKAD